MAVLFLPVAVGGAVFPVLAERVGQRDAAGAGQERRAAVVTNGAAVVPVVAAAGMPSPFMTGRYGRGLEREWPTPAMSLVTARLPAAGRA